MLSFVTAGESHGRQLVSVVRGLPAGLGVDVGVIDLELGRRQKGYGRGGRQDIEDDRAEIISGVRHGLCTGAPVCLVVANKDWDTWQAVMAAEGERAEPEVTVARPGHADLPGALKYGHDDIRDVIERASARETAARVAAGALAKMLLAEFGVSLVSHVTAVGGVTAAAETSPTPADAGPIEDSPVRCLDDVSGKRMVQAIDDARKAGDTLGGTWEVLAYDVCAGLGSYVSWDERLDGRLAQAVMSIPSVKAVQIGADVSAVFGSGAHDVIRHDGDRGYYRETNRAGGLEGGVTNGETVVVKATMKPIPTLGRPLPSVDLATGQRADAHRERSDVCAVPSAVVVGETMVAMVLASAYREKFGGDSLVDALAAHRAYLDRISG